MASKLLNQYQAAALLCMSPELLRELAAYQVKWKDKRRLVVAKEVDGEQYFDEAELKAYDDWLKKPWPSKDGKRPALPSFIREEIRVEANLECAFCKTSGEAGEAAHIDPVATSKCNHPHNLIWLCANHHKKFDDGYFGPKGASNEVIAALKQGLQHFRRMAWQGQADVLRQIAATLSLCKAMQKELEAVKSPLEVEAVEGIAKKALELLPALASQSKVAAVQPTLQHLAAALTAWKAVSSSTTESQLATATSYEAEFLLKSGFVRCPLCHGSKTYKGYDCPVCDGDGVVDKHRDVDLADFEEIDCQLCGGTGLHGYDECPACGGEGHLERYVAQRIDFSQYDNVVCPLCTGERRWDGEDCPECGAEGELPRGAAGRVDLAKYEEVDCPLCEGEGVYDSDTCPECHGDRRMPRYLADGVDVSKYVLQDCPLCMGSGAFLEGDCPACGGNRRMPMGAAERVDLSKYKMVDCPVCDGAGTVNGGDCPRCDGHKQMPCIYADCL